MGHDGGMDVHVPPRTGPSLSLPKVVVACLVFAFAGFGVGSWVNRDRPIPHNAADIGFLRDMMIHHEQAIEMSVVAMRRATSSDVRQEALNILIGQRGEYVQMRDRLRAYGVAPTSPDGSVMAWMGHSMPAAEMPGLATPEQMAALKAASGVELDTQFLRLMTVHHQAGVEMAREAIERGRDRWVLGMADGMVAMQEEEMADMRKWAGFLGVSIDAPAGSTGSSAAPGGTHSHGSADATGASNTTDTSDTTDTTMHDHGG